MKIMNLITFLIIASASVLADFSSITRPKGSEKKIVISRAIRNLQDENSELERVLFEAQRQRRINREVLLVGINFSHYPKAPPFRHYVGALIPGFGLYYGLSSTDKLINGLHFSKKREISDAIQAETELWYHSLTPIQRNDRDYLNRVGHNFIRRHLAAVEYVEEIGITPQENRKFNIAHGSILAASLISTTIGAKYFWNYFFSNK